MDKLRQIGAKLAPNAKKDENDGRDAWPSRTSFLMASCGGAIGMGTVLRYPSTVYNNVGLQFFIPYGIAVLLLAIPSLALELAAGNAYRGGCVVAYNKMSNQLKGTGLALNYIGLVVTTYFVPILSWVMKYFQKSFTSPLPWKGDASEWYLRECLQTVDPIEPEGNGWVSYPGTSLVGDLTGWNIFTWFLVWLCIFKGVGLTGRVVYVTMGLPLILMIILVGRSAALPNAVEGIKLYFGSFHAEKLASGKIWQDAIGQVFFSTGVGFGYYTAYVNTLPLCCRSPWVHDGYASYNQAFANTVQDSVIIVTVNCLVEIFNAFGPFAIIGYLELWPDENPEMGSFELGFVTYPESLAEMPAAGFWSALFFFTFMLLGVSSAFAMLDAVMTMIMDSNAGRKWSRPIVCTVLTVICILVSLPYTTEFGYHYLNGVDKWVNNIALVFVVWAECFLSTTIYRYKDVITQVGQPAFYVYNVFYFLAQVLGVAVAHAVSPGAGAGVGLGLFFIGMIASVFIAQTPTAVGTPKFFQKNRWLSALFYLAFYSGNQLRHDLNAIIGKNGNWKFPMFWAPVLRYITAPILAIVFSLAYPEFKSLKNDPIHIFGFFVAHVVIVLILGGFLVPKWFDVFVPVERREDGIIDVAAGVMREDLPSEKNDQMLEGGHSTGPEGMMRQPSGGSSSSTLGVSDSGETGREKKEEEKRREGSLRSESGSHLTHVGTSASTRPQ